MEDVKDVGAQPPQARSQPKSSAKHMKNCHRIKQMYINQCNFHFVIVTFYISALEILLLTYLLTYLLRRYNMAISHRQYIKLSAEASTQSLI